MFLPFEVEIMKPEITGLEIFVALTGFLVHIAYRVMSRSGI
jgi:hypothetical protein